MQRIDEQAADQTTDAVVVAVVMTFMGGDMAIV